MLMPAFGRPRVQPLRVTTPPPHSDVPVQHAPTWDFWSGRKTVPDVCVTNHRGGEEIVGRNIEEAWNRVPACMVDRHDPPVDTGLGDQIGDHLA